MRLGRLRRCSWELKFSPWPAKATCCTSLYNYHCCLIQLRICWGEPVSHIQWCSRLVEREQSWGPEGELHVARTERPHTVLCKNNRPKPMFNFWKESVSMKRSWKHCKVHIFWEKNPDFFELTTGYSFWDRLRNFLFKFTGIVLSVHKLNKCQLKLEDCCKFLCPPQKIVLKNVIITSWRVIFLDRTFDVIGPLQFLWKFVMITYI